MLGHVGIISVAATVLLFATKSVDTSQIVTLKEGECSIDAKLSMIARLANDVRRKLTTDKSFPELQSQPDDAQSTTTRDPPTFTSTPTTSTEAPSTSTVASSTSTVAPSTSTYTPPNIADAPNLCHDSSIDAITRTADRTTYVFKGEFYWKIWQQPHTKGIRNERPGIISDDWYGLPRSIDAALTLRNGTTFFFKGTHYWRFTNKIPEPGDYPKLIRDGFPGMPDTPDAVFEWGKDNSIYVIKDTKYYKLSQNEIIPSQGQQIKYLKGFPVYVDAAFKWDNGRTYVFKCDVYYRIHTSEFRVDGGYPATSTNLISAEWYRCPK